MQHNHYILNSKKMKIKVVPYLILEFMFYNEKPLHVDSPKGITYLGISKNLYSFYMKDLKSKEFVKIHRNHYEITSKARKRLQSYFKSKQEYIDMFDKFWSIYPNKKQRKAALDAWFVLKLDEKIFDEIIKGTERQIRERKAILAKNPKEFIPMWSNPTTYIRGERWNDELTQDKGEAVVKTTYQKEVL